MFIAGLLVGPNLTLAYARQTVPKERVLYGYVDNLRADGGLGG